MLGRTIVLTFLAAFAIALATLQFSRLADDDVPRAAMVEAPVLEGGTQLPRHGSTAALTRDADGHFRADVAVNGQRVRMLVDSGASMIVIDEATARRLGIVPPETAYTGTALTANGQAAFAPVRLASVSVGNVRRVDVPAGVMRGVSLPTPLLGQSFLGTLSEVKISGDRMELK